jgi:putative endonuclease
LNNYYFGLLSEFTALTWYLLQLYFPIRRRYRNIYGEIDLICKRGNSLVFIEVKGRRNEMRDYITYKQQQRIIGAAELFVANNPNYANLQMRFDLVIIRPYRLPETIRNAWYK